MKWLSCVRGPGRRHSITENGFFPEGIPPRTTTLSLVGACSTSSRPAPQDLRYGGKYTYMSSSLEVTTASVISSPQLIPSGAARSVLKFQATNSAAQWGCYLIAPTIRSVVIVLPGAKKPQKLTSAVPMTPPEK